MSVAPRRIKSGIPGLDELIEGGFPEGRSTLISGATGTGKSIFGVQYLYMGAKQFNEPGIYVTLDERPELTRQDMLRFGWDLREFEERNLLYIIDGSIAKIGIPSEEQFSLPVTGFDVDKLLLEILRVSKRINAKRVVIDSIPAMGLNFENENEIRKAILKLSFMLARTGVTSILISEINETSNTFGKYGVEEYVVDGVIVLHYMGSGMQSNRTMHIRKMRATHHSEDLHPLKISDNGIEIHKVDEAYDE
ncbi:AAA family ATPase [Candidatus Micrarchaeota archaeon]|nr:AAA family ATPase [Candidatus Micrarchaeota archaeon]MBU1930832.1 AAA family ATPase [Candidatus Micrarchaeota archaeon]